MFNNNQKVINYKVDLWPCLFNKEKKRKNLKKIRWAKLAKTFIFLIICLDILIFKALAQIDEPIIPIPPKITYDQNSNTNEQQNSGVNTKKTDNAQTELIIPLPQKSRTSKPLPKSSTSHKTHPQNSKSITQNIQQPLLLPLPDTKQIATEKNYSEADYRQFESGTSNETLSAFTSSVNEKGNTFTLSNLDNTKNLESNNNLNGGLPFFPKDTSSAIFMVMKTWECENYDAKTLISHAIKVYSEESEDQFLQKGLDEISSFNVSLNEEDITLDELLDIIAQKGNFDWGVDVKNKIIYFYKQQNKQP